MEKDNDYFKQAREEARQQARELESKVTAATTDPENQEEWVREMNLLYGGLAGVGVLMIQPFLTASSLDQAAQISVIAFSISIPLLAALVMVNHQEAFRGRLTPSILVTITRVVAQGLGFAGLVAAFWHMSWVAGVGMLAGGIVAVGVHSAGVSRLIMDSVGDNSTPTQE